MLAVNIVTTPDLASWQQALTATEQQVITAAVRALNKTARWARSHLASATAKKSNVKVGLVRNSLSVVRARPSKPSIVVGLNQKAGEIKAHKLGAARQNASGVRVAKRQFDHAFIAQMPNGHQGVFRRRSKSRLPIQEVQIVITGRLRDEMESLSERGLMDNFERIFERELNYLMRVA